MNPKICDKNDRFSGMSGAIACLREGIGNIAWVTNSILTSNYLVRKHFFIKYF